MASSCHGATQFPSLLTSVSDLYGASSLRMCESLEYALDLDALDQEELALEQMVQALVARKAPVPIGVKFHRAPPQCMHGAGSAHQIHYGMHGVDADLDVDDDDDDERDLDGDVDNDDDEEGDDMEEDELADDDDDAFPLDGRDSDDALASGDDDDDPFAHERDSLNDDVSMDMDDEGDAQDDAHDDFDAEEARRRETR